MNWILCCLVVLVTGNDDAKRLYYDLLKRSYNKLIRPVTNSSDKLIVKMGIRLSQLIDIVSTRALFRTSGTCLARLVSNRVCSVSMYLFEQV